MDNYSKANLKFIKQNNLILYEIPIPNSKVNISNFKFKVIPKEKIQSALQILLDGSNYPILVHCNKGKVC